MNNLDKAFYVAVESGDGTGKSTLVKKLVKYFEGYFFKKYGKDDLVAEFEEPSDGEIGQLIKHRFFSKDIKTMPETYALLYTADRLEVCELIKKANQHQKLIISSRCKLSTIAYQSAAGVPVNKLIELNDSALDPHLTIVLHCSLETGIERLAKSGKKQDEFENNVDFQNKVYEAYEQLSTTNNEVIELLNIHVVDAEQDEESVFRECKALILKELEMREKKPRSIEHNFKKIVDTEELKDSRYYDRLAKQIEHDIPERGLGQSIPFHPLTNEEKMGPLLKLPKKTNKINT
jgi:dTMP kinase